MRGASRAAIAAALLGAAGMAGIGGPQATVPSSAQHAKALQQNASRSLAPAQAIQQAASLAILLRHGDITSVGGRDPIWLGRGKAAKRGRARWDYRR